MRLCSSRILYEWKGFKNTKQKRPFLPWLIHVISLLVHFHLMWMQGENKKTGNNFLYRLSLFIALCNQWDEQDLRTHELVDRHATKKEQHEQQNVLPVQGLLWGPTQSIVVSGSPRHRRLRDRVGNLAQSKSANQGAVRLAQSVLTFSQNLRQGGSDVPSDVQNGANRKQANRFNWVEQLDLSCDLNSLVLRIRLTSAWLVWFRKFGSMVWV